MGIEKIVLLFSLLFCNAQAKFVVVYLGRSEVNAFVEWAKSLGQKYPILLVGRKQNCFRGIVNADKSEIMVFEDGARKSDYSTYLDDYLAYFDTQGDKLPRILIIMPGLPDYVSAIGFEALKSRVDQTKCKEFWVFIGVLSRDPQAEIARFNSKADFSRKDILSDFSNGNFVEFQKGEGIKVIDFILEC